MLGINLVGFAGLRDFNNSLRDNFRGPGQIINLVLFEEEFYSF